MHSLLEGGQVAVEGLRHNVVDERQMSRYILRGPVFEV